MIHQRASYGSVLFYSHNLPSRIPQIRKVINNVSHLEQTIPFIKFLHAGDALVLYYITLYSYHYLQCTKNTVEMIAVMLNTNSLKIQ